MVKRGVSPIIATLIMVAATITIGSFTYWYISNFVTATSQQASLGIIATAMSSSGGSILQLSLKNLGNTAILVERLEVRHEKGVLSTVVNRTLAAGATFSITIDSKNHPSLSFTPGKSYSVIIMTNVGNFTSTAVCVGG
ncbi:MAG: hypothetical protein N3H31_01720 [Candidatus Nezhaarchaeota archaeon]|nr:hypothetical protein [Candidatus Nezhaarchaeota archaeon]